MGQPIIQPSFAAGELSPSLYGRVDLAKFHVGAALLENFFVDYRGGVSNRSGTRYILQVKDYTKPVRVIPFIFSVLQAYTLEFGDFTLRVIMNGGYILEASKVVTGATQAIPARLNVAAHGYSNGDVIEVNGIVGMTELNGRTFAVTGALTNSFGLMTLMGASVDSTVYDAYVSGGTVARVYEIATPYAAEDLARLKYVQSADIRTLTHPDYQPQDLTRTGHTAWTITPVDFEPDVATPENVDATPSSAGSTTYSYVVTAIDAKGVQESRPSVKADAASVPMSTTSGAYIELEWDAISGVIEYDIYRTNEVIGAAPGTGALYGFVGSAVDTNFKDQNITPDFTRTPPIAFDPFEGDWPGCATYYDGRKIYGGSDDHPQTFEASKSADFDNFDYSIPARADDSIIQTLASQQVNAIKHLVPMQSLIVLTASGAWKIDGGSNSDVITPSSIVGKPQAYNGCSDVPPLIINYDILYVQSKGSIVRDLAYNFYVNIFTGTDISVMSNHLFAGHRIVEWCWAEEPHKLVWAVREDGVLLSVAFLKEQEVIAWSHHVTQGRVRSICTIPEGGEDAVYMVVERKIADGRYFKFVERLESRNMRPQPEFNTPADLDLAWFVDSGLRYPLTRPDARLFPAATTGTLSVVSALIVNGGSGYTAPTATITDPDGLGHGADITLTVGGGIITGYTITDGGEEYSNPVITVFDSTGSGAVLHPILSNDVVFATDAPVNLAVGDVIRVNEGQGTVRVVNSTISFVVNVTRPLLSDWVAESGEWSATTPVSTVRGLDHLEGLTVSILADGNVQPQQEVVDGSIELEQPASAIVVGLPYRAKFQSLYLDIPGESPTPQGKRKKISAVTFRVQDTRGMRVGHNFNQMVEFKERAFQVMGEPILPITGDERVVVDPLWDVPGQVCADQDYPLPATIVAMIPEITIGDT